MKVFTVILLLSLNSFSQTEKTDEELFSEAYETQYSFYENGLLDQSFFGSEEEKLEAQRKIDSLQQKAYGMYSQFIETRPDSEYVIDAHFEKGKIEFWNNKLINAEYNFSRVINSPNSIQYKRDTFVFLAEISIKHDEFEKAQQYLAEAQKYKSGSWCGVEHEVYQLKHARLSALCSEGLKNKN